MCAYAQAAVASAILAFAFAHVALRFMPKSWRSIAARGAGNAARWIGVRETDARRVEARLASAGACGSCETCKACATAPATRQATSAVITIHRVARGASAGGAGTESAP